MIYPHLCLVKWQSFSPELVPRYWMGTTSLEELLPGRKFSWRIFLLCQNKTHIAYLVLYLSYSARMIATCSTIFFPRFFRLSMCRFTPFIYSLAGTMWHASILDKWSLPTILHFKRYDIHIQIQDTNDHDDFEHFTYLI